MADNLTLNAGVGGATLATDDIGGTHYQIVKLATGVLDTATLVSASNPLPIGDAAGSLTVDNAGTFAVQSAQSGAYNITNISGTVSLPTGAATAAKQPTLGTAGAASADVITIQGVASMTKLLVTPDSVALPANQSVNVNQLAGTATDTNSGVKSAGTLRVVLATDQPALTNKLLVTPDSVALPANQSTNVNQLAGTTTDTNSGNKSAGTLRVVLATDQPALTNKLLVTPDSVALPANQSVNNSQINGVTPLMGNGVTGTGSQRVTIASDNTAFSVNAIPTPQTSGGYSTFHLVSAATTNLTNVKASAGQLFGWYIYNSNAAARKVVFHNNAGAPTAGAGVIFALVIPPGSAANVFTDTGIPFATGIAISTVTDLTDAGTTVVGLNDLVINLFYK